jgi:hypothetical protein
MCRRWATSTVACDELDGRHMTADELGLGATFPIGVRKFASSLMIFELGIVIGAQTVWKQSNLTKSLLSREARRQGCPSFTGART